MYSHTCGGLSQYGQCSANSDCGCFPGIPAENEGVCGFLWVACSHLDRCQMPGYTCEKAGHTCVRHPRCYDFPVCYPLTMSNPKICPSKSSK